VARTDVKGAAEFYGKSKTTIYVWIACGKITAWKDPGGKDWVIEIPLQGKNTLQVLTGPYRSSLDRPPEAT
jgi:hypothetical protein